MLTRLTQAHLALLETCPRKLQHTFLDRLTVPLPPEVQQRQQWGSQFHRLMQQRELGLPLEPLAAENDLYRCMTTLVAAAPAIFTPQPEQRRLSEQRCEWALDDYLFTVIFDLLLLTPQSGQIIDWKTYLQPQSADHLARSWQTRLYLYGLVATTALSPDQVSMTYWFVRPQPPPPEADPSGASAFTPAGAPPPPQSIRLSYSWQQHQQTRADLQRLTAQLQNLQSQSQPFPQVDRGSRACQHCPFAVRCHRPPAIAPDLAIADLANLAAIAEVPI